MASRQRCTSCEAPGLLRQMRLPRGLDLVSNDYLGLAQHPYLTDAMRAALRDLPAGSGGSRLLRGHHEIFEPIEERLADVSGTEAALLFGSGYAANIGLLQAIVSPDDLIVSDEHNHASLIDGIRLTKAAHRRLSTPGSRGAASRRCRSPDQGVRSVITESVFSMDGDLTPLARCRRDRRAPRRRAGCRRSACDRPVRRRADRVASRSWACANACWRRCTREARRWVPAAPGWRGRARCATCW